MPMSGPNRTLGAVLRRIFALQIVLMMLTALAGVAGHLIIRSRYQEVTEKITPTVRTNREILQSMTDAESALRGYRLTGEQDFLTPFNTGRKAYDRAVVEARRYATGDDPVSSRFEAEVWDADRWFDEFADPQIDGKPRSEEVGKAIFEEFRRANADLTALLVDRRTRSEASANRLTVISLCSAGVFTLAAVIVAVRTTRRATRQLTGSVNGLLTALDGLSKGDLTVTAPVRGPVELRTVAASINHLVAETRRLNAHAEELRRRDEAVRAVEQSTRGAVDPLPMLTAAVAVLGPAVDAKLAYVRMVGENRATACWSAEPGGCPVHVPDAPPPATPHSDGLTPEPGEVVISDVHAVASSLPVAWATHLQRQGASGYLSVELRDERDEIGRLVLYRGDDGAWTAADLDMVRRAGREMVRALGLVQVFVQQRDAVDRLSRLDRVRDAFVSTVSHELRTPLTSIAGYLELLRDEDAGALTPAQQTMLGAVDRNTVRLRTLIDDLLTLSSVDAGKFQLDMGDLDLRRVVEGAVQALTPIADAAGLRIEISVPDAAVRVRGDANNLERVLLNLMSNAVKYTPAGGRVTVALTAGPDSAVLAVTDTGYGIPLEEQKDLFTRFFRASNAAERSIPGTGLGLALVRELVTRHDGEVDLVSAVGRGTTVTVRLPLLHQPALTGGPGM